MHEPEAKHSIFDRIIDGFAILAGVLFVYSTVSTCVEVVMRYFFSRPTNWIMEINELILYVAPFIASAWILKQEGHVKMDLLVNSLNPRRQAIVNTITSITGLLICLAVILVGTTVTWEAFQTKYLTAGGHIRITRGYITLFGVLGFILLAGQFVRRALFYFRQASSQDT